MKYILLINTVVENNLSECLRNEEVNYCLLDEMGKEVIPFVYTKKIGLLKRYLINIPENTDALEYLMHNNIDLIDLDKNIISPTSLVLRKIWSKKSCK